MTWKIWLIVSVVALVVEILPPATHFAFLCISLGALSASIVTFFFQQTVWAPWVVFVVVSGVLFPILVPLAKFLYKTPPPTDPTA